MRMLVRTVAGLVSSGSCCVKSVNSGASFHAGSFKSPSMTGGTVTRTACNTGCAGQLAPWTAGAMSNRRRNFRMVRVSDRTRATRKVAEGSDEEPSECGGLPPPFKSSTDRPLSFVIAQRAPTCDERQRAGLQLDHHFHFLGHGKRAMRIVERLLSATQRIEDFG